MKLILFFAISCLALHSGKGELTVILRKYVLKHLLGG